MSATMLSLLLRLYPRRTREAFGSGMEAAWRADLAAAHARGRAATAAWWIATAFDTILFATAVRVGGWWPRRGAFAVDWRDAWRSLRATPLVSLFAIASLALGIGGVTALFSILNSLVLKPLPVREPRQLVLLDQAPWTNPIWEGIRDRQTLIASGAIAWSDARFNLATGSTAEMVRGLWVSGGFFDVLGVPAIKGRTIAPPDDAPGGGAAGPIAVISHRFWQSRYGGAPDVVGRQILVERVPFTIAGVTDERFQGPDVGSSFDVAVPLGVEPMIRGTQSALTQRLSWWLNVMVRLKPGQTAEQATALLRAVQPQIREASMPDLNSADQRARFLSEPLTLVPAPGGRSPLRSRYEQPLTIVLGIVGVVLIIACANIANLLIARAATRRRELAVRMALGASRFRIARQLFAETALLTAAGATLGIYVAVAGGRLIIAQLSTSANRIDLDLTLDWRVLGFALAVTTLAAFLAGITPAFSVSGLAPNEALKEDARTVPGGRARLRHASVVLQVALSLCLVFGAGLFSQTFVRLTTRDLGFNPRGVLLMFASAPRDVADAAARTAVFSRLVETARAVPGVAAAAVSFTTPVGVTARNEMIAVPADSRLTRRERLAWVNVVSPGWFETLQFRRVAGRDFDGRDRKGGALVAIVNRAFERRFLDGGPAVGRTFTTALIGNDKGPAPRYEVIGVVEDAIYRSLRSTMDPTVYLPVAQEEADPTMVLPIRAAAGRPEALVAAVAAAIQRQEPSVLLSFRTMDDQMGASVTQERLVATLAAFFGGLALLLAALGLYGVTAYAVAARRAEIGLRMALGATPLDAIRVVLRRIAVLVAAGLTAGIGLAAWAARYVESLLYGIAPRDPRMFAAAAALLLIIAAIAAWLPARRATRLDPVAALRQG